LEVIRFPLDFSWSVKRVLRRIKPSLIVLAECELWPNFLLAARREGVPVTVINARISPRSFRRYRRIRFAARWMFGMVARFAVQTQAYSDNLQLLGVPAERLAVTGSVKYDGATGDRSNPRTAALRGLLGISPGELVWVAGSTQAPEEEIALAVFRRLQTEFPTLRLILVPRQKDRFDDVAQTLKRSGATFARRSELTTATTAPIVLVDTIGELNAVWGLANVAFVGGSLDGKRGGQNMIEPAAYGAAVVFGPHVWNFRDAAARLIEARAAIQISDAAELEAVVRQLFDDPDTRRDLGDNARRLVRDQQGATIRTVELLAQMLERALPSRVAG
jgi:3-deoxy-D-manno-octulosonic-acid transferase